MSNIQSINHLSHAFSSEELDSNGSSNNFTADQNFFTASFSLDSQHISATPLFTDGTPIHEINSSIIDCIIGS